MSFISLVTFGILLSPCLANFHIMSCEAAGGLGSQTYQDAAAITLNSNTYNCAGLSNAAYLGNWNGRGHAPSFMSTDQGKTCGYDLNFYSEGQNFGFYKSGGNGQKLGDCYPDSGGELRCPIVAVH
ncbi:hypothetical protein COCVIDRAFT_21205 [Bipolaris victoriae FI3]|uniref:AA1-like domain-containing protein n=1 Tax=Bipolaris victoriae (strain FI3) TaxID=930091 RepID=W7DXI3_BIPV3|nr:hypothetical protein COCVIDRAFT_21205 [Bipolaris victoriae FI3]